MNIMLHFFHLNPHYGQFLAWILLLLLCLSAHARLPHQKYGSREFFLSFVQHPLSFAILVAATMISFLWPGWFAGALLNPDESEMISGARTLLEAPYYWKSVDGTTHGPLNEVFLLLAPLLGMPLSFASARCIAAFLKIGALLFLWLGVRRHLPDRHVRLGVLPAVVFWSFAVHYDFTQYSSELVAIFLLSVGAWAGLAGLEAKEKWKNFYIFLCGLFLGMPVFAKLQALLLNVLLVLLFVLAFREQLLRAGKESSRIVLHFCLGLLTFPAIFCAYLLTFGLSRLFGQMYLESNLFYAQHGNSPLIQVLANSMKFAGQSTFYTPFALGSLAFIFLCVLSAYSAPPQQRKFLSAGWMLFFTALYTIFAPRREFVHYLNFTVLPLSFLLMTHLSACSAWLRQNKESAPLSEMLLQILMLWFTLVPAGAAYFTEKRKYPSPPALVESSGVSPVAAYIRERSLPGDKLAVWGWMPRYYVETGLPQACRSASSYYLLNPHVLQAQYRNWYLKDFSRTQPRWFIDAVGDGAFAFTDRARHAHETFAGLRSLIERKYELVAEINSNRIYRRKERR